MGIRSPDSHWVQGIQLPKIRRQGSAIPISLISFSVPFTQRRSHPRALTRLISATIRAQWPVARQRKRTHRTIKVEASMVGTSRVAPLYALAMIQDGCGDLEQLVEAKRFEQNRFGMKPVFTSSREDVVYIVPIFFHHDQRHRL